MRSRILLALLFFATACASACVVLLLGPAAPEAGRTIAAEPEAATASVTPSPANDPSSQLLARLAFADGDAPLPLRFATLHDLSADDGLPEQEDLTDAAPGTAWTEGMIVESDNDPAPEVISGWTNSTKVNRASLAPAVPAAMDTRALPIVRVALPRDEQPIFQTARHGPLAARLAQISPAATLRLAEKFRAAGAAWPPVDATLLAIKDTRTLELHARGISGGWTFIHRYKVLAASGRTGPKLRKGDLQVPEGVYKISYLNPNSRYHVSLRVNYPNAFDMRMAAKERRTQLGGDIMIHGKAVSAGCLAVGDEAAEELFVLAGRIGLAHVSVIIAPADFRSAGIPAPQPGDPAWLPQLYAQLSTEMAAYKAPPASGIASGLLSFFGK